MTEKAFRKQSLLERIKGKTPFDEFAELLKKDMGLEFSVRVFFNEDKKWKGLGSPGEAILKIPVMAGRVATEAEYPSKEQLIESLNKVYGQYTNFVHSLDRFNNNLVIRHGPYYYVFVEP